MREQPVGTGMSNADPGQSVPGPGVSPGQQRLLELFSRPTAVGLGQLVSGRRMDLGSGSRSNSDGCLLALRLQVVRGPAAVGPLVLRELNFQK